MFRPSYLVLSPLRRLRKSLHQFLVFLCVYDAWMCLQYQQTAHRVGCLKCSDLARKALALSCVEFLTCLRLVTAQLRSEAEHPGAQYSRNRCVEQVHPCKHCLLPTRWHKQLHRIHWKWISIKIYRIVVRIWIRLFTVTLDNRDKYMIDRQDKYNTY